MYEGFLDPITTRDSLVLDGECTDPATGELLALDGAEILVIVCELDNTDAAVLRRVATITGLGTWSVRFGTDEVQRLVPGDHPVFVRTTLGGETTSPLVGFLPVKAGGPA